MEPTNNTTDQLEARIEETPRQDAAEADDNAREDKSGTGDKAGREAARYRRQLREVEAERDALTEHLNRYRRAEVEATTANQLSMPGLLFSDGRGIADYLDDEGNVDAAKVKVGVTTVLEAYGDGARRQRPAQATHEGANPRPSPSHTMADYLRS